MGWVTSTLKSNVLALTAAFLVLVFGSVVHAQFDFVQRADFSTDARVDMVLHDVDGDGDVDLITADSILNQVGIQLGNGDGTFAAPATVTIAAGTRALAVGDINGDTFSDILVTRPGTLAGGNGIISVLLNQGNGTFLRRWIIL